MNGAARSRYGLHVNDKRMTYRDILNINASIEKHTVERQPKADIAGELIPLTQEGKTTLLVTGHLEMARRNLESPPPPPPPP